MALVAVASSAFPRVGKYVVGRRIGAGGMAVVDAAFQPGPGGGRLVALKRIASPLSADPSARRLFLREASIMTRLEHPNVVRTYEVGEVEGETFIAMELLEGATVADLQRVGVPRLPLPIALRIARDALRGLHAAHELPAANGDPLGLVHQDVSPHNVHVAYEGTTRVLDFGVARMAAIDASRTDSIRGKACYLAPEQLKLRSVDRRADVFAFGILLHELLTGAHLFPRAHADAAYAAILSGDFPSPRAVCADVPAEIDAVVTRALAMDPAERFPSADEMRRALLRAQLQAGIEDVDVADVGACVQAIVAPPWTRAELERAFREPAILSDSIAAAELPTLAPRKARAVTHGGPNEKTWGFRRRPLALVGIAVVLAGGVIVFEGSRPHV
ncbi:MAG TPA: serine/threonine-protein kinase, partial [Polyangiaceae bacterium]